MIKFDKRKGISKWERIRDFFISVGIYKDVTRKQYLAYMASLYGIGEATCDNCRCILMTAGYLKRTGRGWYQRVKCISCILTYSQARKEAYGK